MPDQNPLTSLDEYSRFAAELTDHPTVLRSTFRVWSVSPHTGVAEGEIFFPDDLKLRILEELDFADALITG